MSNPLRYVLQGDKGMDDLTHVIVDEVHERSLLVSNILILYYVHKHFEPDCSRVSGKSISITSSNGLTV